MQSREWVTQWPMTQVTHWALDPWPMWPIRFSWPIWPMTHDSATHFLLWPHVLEISNLCEGGKEERTELKYRRCRRHYLMNNNSFVCTHWQVNRRLIQLDGRNAFFAVLYMDDSIDSSTTNKCSFMTLFSRFHNCLYRLASIWASLAQIKRWNGMEWNFSLEWVYHAAQTFRLRKDLKVPLALAYLGGIGPRIFGRL